MIITHNTVIKIGGNLVEKQSRINPQQGEFCNTGISRHNENLSETFSGQDLSLLTNWNKIYTHTFLKDVKFQFMTEKKIEQDKKK